MSDCTIEVTLNRKQMELFRTNPEKYLYSLRLAIDKDLPGEISDDRLELVRIITRTKASVVNWNDMEKEIFKGGI